MEPACIRHTELPGTSRLFADFSYHFDRVERYYRHNPHDPASLAKAAAEIEYPDARRAEMHKVLASQNADGESLRRFAKPGTVAVVTGQQVGLFSGPAYTIFKALTAVRAAQNLNDRGIPAVPIFWLASEDHDFPEVNHVWIYDSSHSPIRLEVAAPADAAGRSQPAGTVRIAQSPVEELGRTLSGFPFADEIVPAVARAYRPGVTMGEGFRELLKDLLAPYGVLFLDPLDPGVRAAAVPFIVEALKAAPDLKAKLLERNKELTSSGYHAQVHMEAKTSLFFLLEKGERVGLRRKDSEYKDFINRATDISPNALLRPVMQDFLLPTAAYVGGPAELAYFAQSRVIYDQLLGRMPVILSRSCFTLLDARAEKLLKRYKLDITGCLVHGERLKERLATALVPASIEHALSVTTSETARLLVGLGAEIESFDHTLGAALEKSRSKILYQLEKIRRKTARETLRRDARASEDAQFLLNSLYPHRHLQERFYSILPFLAQHGRRSIDQMLDAASLTCPDHRVLTL